MVQYCDDLLTLWDLAGLAHFRYGTAGGRLTISSHNLLPDLALPCH
jgi:hypothetical protein